MHLLIVTFGVPRPDARSGAAVVMHGQIEALRANHDLTLVTFGGVEDEDAAAIAALRASGVKVHVIGEAIPRRILQGKRAVQRWLDDVRGRRAVGNPGLDDPRLPRLIRRLLARERFDVLQVEDVGVSAFKFVSPIPTLLVEHEVRVGASAGTGGHVPYQPSLWRQSDRIQVFSERDARAIGRLAPDVKSRVRVNPFGIEIRQSRPVDPEPGVMVFIGGYQHAPNVDASRWLANEIMPLVRQSTKTVRLVLVGNSPPREVRDLACADVDVTGDVPDVDAYLDRAAVVVAPVRQGGGMRVKVMQAMAHGRPVVSTSLGVEGLHGGRDGLPVVVAESSAEFATAIADLLMHPEKARKLGERSRTFVATHHSWAGYASRLEAIYAELVVATA